MTYDSRKILRGQEFVEEIELVLDACKYTLGAYKTDRSLNTDNVSTVSAAATNVDIVLGSLSGTTWTTTWGSSGTKYGKTSYGEIVAFTVNSVTSIKVTQRGLFGTTAHTIPRFTGITIMHKGEADNSCRGYPYGCSNSDSYDINSKIRPKFAVAPSAGGTLRFPGLNHGSCNHTAGEVDPGESIGTRASLSFSIKDQKHDDNYLVPYPEKRSESGTMFGKLLARHPYMAGREFIYRAGFRNAGSLAEPDWIERSFIIDTANLSDDKFSVKGLDPLILTEDKKAKMPVSSPAVLAANIDSSATSFSYIDAPDYYFGPNASVRYIRIDAEVLWVTVTGPKVLTVSGRGYKSEAKDHEAGASIQDCIRFDDTNGIDAIVFALQNYTSIKSAFIGDYSAVKALLPGFVLDDCLISKPMAVSDFIDSMVKLGNLVFTYDEIAKKISIDYTPELNIQPIFLNGRDNIIRDSVKIDDNIKNQFTRFAHLWAPVDITKDAEENYAIRYMPINLDLESPKNLGLVNEKKFWKNPLLTNSAGDSLLATSYASRVLDNSASIPKIVTVSLDAKDIGATQGGNLKLGSIVNLNTQENQDKDGNSVSELFQVLSIRGNAFEGFKVKMRRYQAVTPDDVDFILDTSAINFNLSTVFTPAAGHYTIYINPGVEFGSYNAASPAFTTGSQAAGVSFTIINRGAIYGMGGAGGDGQLLGTSATPATNGQAGGNAIELTVPTTIDNGSGLIWSGAGGSGGGPMNTAGGGGTVVYTPSYGGGGGQGYGSSLSGQYSNGGSFSSSGPFSVSYNGRRANGSFSSPGETNGAEWGQDGNRSLSSLGGLAGLAIKSNGNAVTIISGDNDLNIKGRRS